MKIKMAALELILHLAEGSTTPNTLQHISKIAKATLDEMKEQKEMQPFIDLTNESYLRGVHDGRMATQRTWVGLTEQDMPSGEDPMFDHQYFIAGMVYADKVLKEKNA